MPGHGLQARGIAREQKMIYAGMTLFLEQGYERTTTAQISSIPEPFSTSSMGFPAVPEGSPSSEERSTGLASSTW